MPSLLGCLLAHVHTLTSWTMYDIAKAYLDLYDVLSAAGITDVVELALLMMPIFAFRMDTYGYEDLQSLGCSSHHLLISRSHLVVSIVRWWRQNMSERVNHEY